MEDFGSAYLQCAEGHSIFVDVSWRHVGPHERFAFEIVGVSLDASSGIAVAAPSRDRARAVGNR